MSLRRRDVAPGPTATETLVDALRACILEGDIAPGEPQGGLYATVDYSLDRMRTR